MVDDDAAGGLGGDHSFELGVHIGEGVVHSLPVGVDAPEGLDLDGGESAGDVAGVDVGHPEGAV